MEPVDFDEWGPHVAVQTNKHSTGTVRVSADTEFYEYIKYAGQSREEICAFSNFVMLPVARVGKTRLLMKIKGQSANVLIDRITLNSSRDTVKLLIAHGFGDLSFDENGPWSELVQWWIAESKKRPVLECHTKIGRVSDNLYLLSNNLQLVRNKEGVWTFTNALSSAHAVALPVSLSSKPGWSFEPEPNTLNTDTATALQHLRTVNDLMFQCGTNVAHTYFVQVHTFMSMFASTLTEGIGHFPGIETCAVPAANKSTAVKVAQSTQSPFQCRLPLHFENVKSIKTIEDAIACIENMAIAIDDCNAIKARVRAEFIKEQMDLGKTGVQSINNPGHGIMGQLHGLERRMHESRIEENTSVVPLNFNGQVSAQLPFLYRCLPALLEAGDMACKTWMSTGEKYAAILPEGNTRRQCAQLLHFGIRFGGLIGFDEAWVVAHYKEFVAPAPTAVAAAAAPSLQLRAIRENVFRRLHALVAVNKKDKKCKGVQRRVVDSTECLLIVEDLSFSALTEHGIASNSHDKRIALEAIKPLEKTFKKGKKRPRMDVEEITYDTKAFDMEMVNEYLNGK